MERKLIGGFLYVGRLQADQYVYQYAENSSI